MLEALAVQAVRCCRNLLVDGYRTNDGLSSHELTRQSKLPLADATAFTKMYDRCILMQMRTTLIINGELLRRAKELTGIQKNTALVRAGLEALIVREAGKRLAALGGTQPKISSIARRRSG